MRMQSPLIGAAVAAVLFLPANADGGWVNGSWQTYDARNLKLEDMVGNVVIDVKDSGPIAVQISGESDLVSKVHVSKLGNTVTLDNERSGQVWDWKHWLDFSRGGRAKPNQLQIHVVVPKGAAIDAEVAAGNAKIGDTMGPLTFSVQGHSESWVGSVSYAKLEMEGSGKLNVANVAGQADVETAGSGAIRIGDVGRVKAEIAGSGAISVGNVRSGGIDVDIAGSGDFSAQSVSGPVSASIAGSGSVSIANGEANPFKVEIMGSGNVSFGGVAVNPRIEAMGSGSVKIRSYRGSLSNDGMAKVSIGN